MRLRIHALRARLTPLIRTALQQRLLGPVLALGGLLAGLALAVSLALATVSDAFLLESHDGRPFVAEVRGEGGDWVLLGHQYPTHRHTWDTLMERLLAEGYRVMRWDFRCHGESRCNLSGKKIDDAPDIVNEWEAAIDYAATHGAERIYGLGASFGGTSLMQVAAYRSEFTAVSAISSPNIFPNQPPENYRPERLDGLSTVAQITVPKLYIVGATNKCAYLYSERFYERSVAPSRLVVLDTDLHGTSIIGDSEWGEPAIAEILAFLADPGALEGKQLDNRAPEADPLIECYGEAEE